MTISLKSFRGRFLLIAGVLFLFMLAIAIYTNSMVNANSKKRPQFIASYKLFQESFYQAQDSLRYIQSSVYSYSLLLQEKYHIITRQQIWRLHHAINAMRNHSFARQKATVRSLTDKIHANTKQLVSAVQELMNYQLKPDKLLPGMHIILEELQPTRVRFNRVLQNAVDEIDADVQTNLDNLQLRAIQRLLLDIRYVWAQQISTVRVLVANRNGAFGNPILALQANFSDIKAYSSQVRNLILELKNYDNNKKLSPELSEFATQLLAEHKRYAIIFNRVEELLKSSRWRTDVHLIDKKLHAFFRKTLMLLQQLNLTIHRFYENQMDSLQKTAVDLGTYIWLYFIISMLALYLFYLLYEYTIQIPLLNIGRALEAEGGSECYEIPASPLQSIETKSLEASFRQMQHNVQSRQARLEAILMQAGEGIIIVDNKGIIETFNKAAELDFKYSAKEVIGQPVVMLLSNRYIKPGLDVIALWAGDEQRSKQANREFFLKRKDDSEFPASVNVNRLQMHGELLYVAVIADMSDHKKMLLDLQRMANQDDLTKLHNRRYFSVKLNEIFENKSQCSLLYVDLDNFKFINDTLGHVAGDKALKDLARLLSRCLHKDELVARIGGDEFAVLLSTSDLQSAQQIAESIRNEISKYNLLYRGKVVDLSCSIGVAVTDESIASAEELMSAVDIACNIAKKEGRNRVHIFNSEDNSSKNLIYQDMGWAREIKIALEQNRFLLVQQPIVHTHNLEIYCHEILTRMLDAKGEIIMPSGFINAAERFGLIADIDEWVVKNVIALVQHYRASGILSRFSVNISGQSISNAKFVASMTDLLKKAKLQPGELIFEITETVAIEKMSAAIHFIKAVQALGCYAALDDFGVGYSSYAYLKDLPVDIIKIDGTFINNIDTDELSLAMVKSMQEIASVMGKLTIAEYVDKDRVLQILKQIGVHYSQGFYLGPPQVIDMPSVKTRKLN